MLNLILSGEMPRNELELENLFQDICTYKKKENQEVQRNMGRSFARFEPFFNKLFRDARVCQLNGGFFWERNGVWMEVDTDIVKSIAYDFSLDRSYLDMHLASWIAQRESQLLIDIPEWDGKDHIGQMVSTMKFANFTNEQAKEIFSHWLSGTWRRLRSNVDQNYFLLLRGAQGVGKDYVIRRLCEPLGRYFVNFTMQSQEKDIYDQCTSALIVNMSEFDQTEKLNVAFIKDLVTKYEATFRNAYSKHAVTRRFHCSFIGTTNAERVLRDETGSRRFIIMEVEDIDRGLFPHLNFIQMWAQAKVQIDYKMSSEVEILKDSYNDHEAPDNDLELNIVECWNHHMASRLKARKKDELLFADVIDVFHTVKKDLALKSINLVHQVVNKYQGKRKTGTTRYYRLAVTPDMKR